MMSLFALLLVMSATSYSATYTYCPTDINRDGVTNVNDFLSFAPLFGSNCGDGCYADFNNDSKVDINDFLIFSPQFNVTCTVVNNDVVKKEPSIANSSIVGSGPVIADGVAASTITVTIRDSNHAGISGVVPTFTSTNPGSTNVYGACSLTDANGISTCSLKSLRSGTRTLSLVSPVANTGGNVKFLAGPAAAAQSTITASGPVLADGVATSIVSILLKDANGNLATGVVPTLSASGSGNTFSACSATDSAGMSTCTLTSTMGEKKTVLLVSPISKSAVVVFTPTQTQIMTLPSSMYVYDYDNAVMGTQAEQDQVLQFAQDNHISTIYLSADQYFSSPVKLPNLTAFISYAKTSYDMDTILVLGHYDWCYTVNHPAALQRTNAVLTYLASLPLGAVKPKAIQYDVEPHAASDTGPYALVNWANNMQSVANQYLDLVQAIVSATDGIIPVQFTTANFYNGKIITRVVNGVSNVKSFSQWIIDVLNSTGSIVVMNYRDNVSYTKVNSNNGVLSTQTYSNKVQGTATSHNVTDDIAYASLSANQGKKVYQAFNTNCKTADNFGVTEANCASVLSLNAAAYASYGSACNQYWDYKASSFCEEGKDALLSNGVALQQAYGTSPTYSAYAGWGVFAYKYFKALK